MSPYSDDMLVLHIDSSENGTKGDVILKTNNVYETCTKVAMQMNNEDIVSVISEGR